MAAWKPIIETQVLGQYADAWSMMKEMPQFQTKLQSGDPFYVEFYNMNENGQYQEAFDKMMKWKIEKFGVDMVKQMGYDVSGYIHTVENPYHKPKPVTYYSNGQKWEQFYESMSPTASGEELQKFWQKHAEMKKELGTNDSYHKEKHDDSNAGKDWEKWIPIQKLQQAGDYEGAWNLMKHMPEILEKAKEPDMAKFIELNESGQYETAFDGMMMWKIDQYGADVVESWGYDVSKYTNGTTFHKTHDSWQKWVPMMELQQKGDLEGAWTLMKQMPDFDQMKSKPGMAKFIALNEAGEYQLAYDGMIESKIEKFGAETVKSWGYDISDYVKPKKDWSKWAPIKELQKAGDYKGAWELMQEMDDFDQMAEKPHMKEFIRLNENGQYEDAFHAMMQWKVDTMGADKVASWGYDVSNYVTGTNHSHSYGHPHPKPHGPPHHRPDTFYTNGKKWEEFYNSLSPTASAEEIKQFWEKHAEMKRELGTNDSYHKTKPEHGHGHGYGHGYAPGKPHWWEKKQMFYESGMAELVKPIMNADVMEDIVAAVENMGGMEKLLGKVQMYSDPEFAQLQKNMKEKKTAAMTLSTLHGAVSLMDIIVKDANTRSTVDRLAKLDKQLPEASTCPSYTGMLSCAMEGHLASTPYTDHALWPGEMLDAYLKMGMVTPKGPGTQSVLSMPNLSAYFSTDNDMTSVMATVTGSVRHAITSGLSCIAPWVDDFDFNEIDLDYTDGYTFHEDNKPVPLTKDQADMLTVKSWAGEHKPVARVLMRTCQAAVKTVEELRKATEPDRIKELKLKLGGQTNCHLIFNENIPLWPSCNPLDNGQFYERMWTEKNKIKVVTVNNQSI